MRCGGLRPAHARQLERRGTYYRCVFLSQYAAKDELDHPRLVYLRDDQVLELEAAQDRTETPADKAEVYGQLGLTLTYDAARRRLGGFFRWLGGSDRPAVTSGPSRRSTDMTGGTEERDR